MFVSIARIPGAWEPWRQLATLPTEVNRIVGAWRDATCPFPQVNVSTGAEGATLTAYLPGVDPKELDISVVGEVVTLRGRRAGPDAGAGAAEGRIYHRNEREHGEFDRRFELPFRVDAEQVTARYEHGILELTLPRVAEERPRRVAIQGAGG